MRSPWRGCAATLLAGAVLSGQIIDRTTGQPLPGVTVSVAGAHVTTDRDGRYAIKGAKPGTWTLTAVSSDVPAQHFKVTVGSGTTHRDLRVCSTTLDYNCGSPAAPAGNS